MHSRMSFVRGCDRSNGQDISPWKSQIHPDGLRYFSYTLAKENVRFLTEADLLDGDYDYTTALQMAVKMVMEDLRRDAILSPDAGTIDVLFEINDRGWYYYMADRKRKSIFWLRRFEATWMTDRIGGVGSKAHLGVW